MTTTTKYLKEFVQISSLLTGFSEVELEATGMVKTYFKTIVERTEGSIVEKFFERTAAIIQQADRKAAIRSQLIPDSAYQGLAKKIIILWYEGNWGVGPSAEVISPQSYVQGLMWLAAKTHPSGAKQPGFASWAEPPLSKTDNSKK